MKEIKVISDTSQLEGTILKQIRKHKIGVGGTTIEASDKVIERFKKATVEGGYDAMELYNGFPVRNGANVYLYQSAIFYKTNQ